MANLKITNPQVIGKLKLLSESASKALQVNASGELESSAVTLTELGYLSGVTSAIQTQLGTKALASDLTSHTGNTSNPHSVTKTQVGLGNVDNTSDANKPVSTATQTALDLKAPIASPTFTGTVSGITKAMVGLGNVDNTSDANKPVSTAQQTALDLKINSSLIGANSGVASLDAGGKVPVAQLPSAVMTYEGTWAASTNTPALANGTGNAGMVYIASDAGSVNFGAGAVVFAAGDWVVYSGAIWEKSINSNAVASVNGQTGAVTITKSDVGLGNVDNTSDANKPVSTAQQTALNLKADLASPTFTGTVSGISKTMVGLGNVDNVQQLPLSYLDTDNTLAADSDAKVASQKATKAYIAAQIGASAHSGDIAHTAFAAANNQVAAANVTGLAFAAGSVRSFRAQVSVAINATTGLNEVFELLGVQLAAGFVMSSSSVGDDSGVVFTITSAGQIQYTSGNSAGFVANSIKFRASVTDL